MVSKKKIIPMIFKSSECPNCGEKDSIRFVDEFNNVTTNLSENKLGTYQVRCLSCAKKYTMIWENDNYMLEDFNLSICNFGDFYYDHKKRDIDKIAEKEYELPT